MMQHSGELIAAVEACVGRDVVHLATALLTFCRRHLDVLEPAFDEDRYWAGRLNAENEAAAVFSNADSPVVEPGDVEKLVAVITSASRQIPSPLVSYACSEALDRTLGKFYYGFFRQRGDQRLASGDAFPVVSPDLKTLLAGELNTNPEKIDRRLDGSRRLRLLPHNFRFPVHLAFTAAAHLDALPDACVVGIALVNRHLSDDHSSSEVTWDRFTEQGRHLFFRVRPRDEARQLARIRQFVAEAEEKRIDLLLFPELSFTPEILTAVQLVPAARQAPHPRILVAGSAHDEREGRRWNRSTVLLSNGATLEHCKFESFSVQDLGDGGTEPRVERWEGVTHAPLITLHLSKRWSFVVLICKDFMSMDVVAALAELRVRLVVVPAWSLKTEVLEANADALLTHAQAHVAVANAASEGVPAAAVLWGAPRLGRSRVKVLDRTDVTPPTLVTYQAGE